mmetsp:Transcript_99110/g.121322  ORF Transcript_99110/g.121322 Transcript_99110/m.121322 type:complete len:345 (-) Transcript_99110:62-1096(-)
MLCCKRKKIKSNDNDNEISYVIVVGGGNGMGLETVIQLLLHTNFIVFVGDIDNNGLNKLKMNYNKYKRRLYTFVLDITDKESINNFVRKLNAVRIKSNIVNNKNNGNKKYCNISPYCYRLIISVGIFIGKPILELSYKEFSHILNVNVIGIWNVIQLMYKHDIFQHKMNSIDNSYDPNNNTRIIVFSSEVAFTHPVPFGEPYRFSKETLQNLCRVLRIELSTIDIDVVTINPGAVKTGLLKETRNIGSCKKDSLFKIPSKMTILSSKMILKTSFESTPKIIIDKCVMNVILCHRNQLRNINCIRRTWINVLLPYIPNFIYDYAIIKTIKLWTYIYNRNQDTKDL